MTSILPKKTLPQQFDEGYILHTSPWRETSLICEVFTKNFGRLLFTAKGARAPRSALRGQILAFHKLKLHWRGKGEIPTIAQVEWIGEIGFLNKSALIAGYYINELLLNLVHRNDPHEHLFELYNATICTLYQHPEELIEDNVFIENCLRRFEVLLIREIGYGLRFGKIFDSDEKVCANKNYLFEIGVGVHHINVITQNKNNQKNLIPITGSALLLLENFANPQEQFEVIIPNNREILQEQKQLMRALINHNLEHKVLHSRKLMADLVHFRKL